MNPADAVAQTGSLPYRRLVIRKRRHCPAPGRLPVGDTAGCQPALLRRRGSWSARLRFLRMYAVPEPDRPRTAAGPQPQRMAMSQAPRTFRTFPAATRCELGQLAVPNRKVHGKGPFPPFGVGCSMFPPPTPPVTPRLPAGIRAPPPPRPVSARAAFRRAPGTAIPPRE
jgi:hypothetical protein